MPDLSPVFATPLLEESVSCRARCTRKSSLVLVLLSLVLGSAFVVLLSSVVWTKSRQVQVPAITMPSQSFQLPRVGQPTKPLRSSFSQSMPLTGAWPFARPAKPVRSTCGRAVRSVFGFLKPTPAGFLPEAECLPGSDKPIANLPPPDATHFVKGTSLWGPWPEGMQEAMFGFGCFWCSENLYMNMEGVHSTQVGYAGGATQNPSYADICTGRSNHNEVVRVVYDPKVVSYRDLLKIFWEKHNPTTPFQQGNDVGTQYRSGIYFYNEAQKEEAEKTKSEYQTALKGDGFGDPIHTEIVPAPKFWMAEDYHQQYDAKPDSRRYCGLSPTGVELPGR